MTGIDVRDLRLGDVLRLRKPHVCGNVEWEVVRLGVDIGLTCARCGRRVLIERPLLERRVTAVVKRGDGPTAGEIIGKAEQAHEDRGG